MFSKPLSAYEPLGEPGAMPDGVAPSVTLCALAVLVSDKTQRQTIMTNVDREQEKYLVCMADPKRNATVDGCGTN